MGGGGGEGEGGLLKLYIGLTAGVCHPPDTETATAELASNNFMQLQRYTSITVINNWAYITTSFADQGSGAFLTPGSGMNIADHFSKSLETFLGLKILKFFDADADPGSGIFLTLDPGWKNSDPG